jgi:proteic killer suppression protein
VKITFRDRELRKVCNSQKDLERTFGRECASLLRRRLDDLIAAPSLETLRPPFPGRCREAKKSGKGLLTLDLLEPYRLMFEPCSDGEKQKRTDGVDWDTIKAIRILEVDDAHD